MTFRCIECLNHSRPQRLTLLLVTIFSHLFIDVVLDIFRLTFTLNPVDLLSPKRTFSTLHGPFFGVNVK